jgi:LCP family protein required for cell wall assembly
MIEKEWHTTGVIDPKEPPNLLPKKPDELPKQRKHKRLLIGGIFLLCVIFGGIIAKIVIPASVPENPLEYDPITLEPKQPEGLFQKFAHFVFSKELSLQGENNDRINILLLGIGGEGHDGPNLSDTIMIASIKPSTKQLALTSIPRDLLVDIPGHGQNKINAANAFGEGDKPHWGGALATDVVNKTFGIDVPYYIRIDFAAFKEIIDTVGGVTVNVETSFTDPLYPTNNFGYKTVAFSKGITRMDGNTALEFARSRHGSNGEGSDFARAKRQQKVILAMKEKVLAGGALSNPLQIKSIMDSLDKHMTTNMNFAELLTLLKIGRQLDTTHIQTVTLDTSEKGFLQSGTSDEGAFILEPKTGNFDGIHDAIAGIFNNATIQTNDTPLQAPITKISASSTESIEVQNGTWRAGLAARMKKRLEDRGYLISTIGNTTERPQSISGIYSIGTKINQTTLEALKAELHIPLRKQLPPNIIPAAGTDIFVLLGEDMEE